MHVQDIHKFYLNPHTSAHKVVSFLRKFWTAFAVGGTPGSGYAEKSRHDIIQGKARRAIKDLENMSTAAKYPHLTIGKDGTPRIGQTRYKVIHLATEHFQHGWTAEELLRQHPDLRPEEVYSALTYFYDHRDAMVAEMKASMTVAEDAGWAQPFSREELLRRKPVEGS